MSRSAALHAAQDNAARWAAGIAVGAHAIATLMSLVRPGAWGMPPFWVLFVALIPTVAIAYAITRRQPHARHVLVWFWGVTIPLLVREPFVHQRPALAIFAPVALAAFLTGPRTVIAMAIVPLGIMLGRTGLDSPYDDVGYVTIFAVLTAIMLATQRTMITALNEAERASALFSALAEETNEIITIAGAKQDGRVGPVEYVSPSVTRVLGYPVNEPKSMSWADVVHPDDLPKIAKMSAEIRSAPGVSATEQFRMRHKDGDYHWMVARGTNLLTNPHVRGVLSTFVDVTGLVSDREAVEDKLEHDARHDAATGLPNRRFLSERLSEAIEAVGRGEPRALLFVDIDGFKLVNDSLGHDFGEVLITNIAERFRPQLDEHASLFRFGGDELVVLLEQTAEDAATTAEKLVTAMQKPFSVGDREIFVTASIGVAHIHDAHDRPDAILKDADLAMYRAKERGRNRWERFDSRMREQSERRHAVEQALRSAIENREFRLVYQPKVSAEDGRLMGFEALARWQCAKLGAIGPVEFVPLAEETGLIEEIGRWVLAEACQQLRTWQKRSPRLAGLKMAVNLSGRQLLGREDPTDDVKRILEENAVPPWNLELEITESVLMTHAAKAVERLERLKALGVKLAIDDFGTGYSSLSYLRRFPVDVLKIDRAFVTGLGRVREDSAIVHLIVTLAQALGLTTVAEGVETHEQLDELKTLGCEQIQGFLIAKPLEVADATALLERSFSLPEAARLPHAAEE